MTENYYLNKSAKEAYKAYVRAYDSHSLKEIFDVNKLELKSVAKSFGFGVPPFVELRMLFQEIGMELFNFAAIAGRSKINREKRTDQMGYGKKTDNKQIYKQKPQGKRFTR